MHGYAGLIIREALRKSGAKPVFASLFGSYRRGDYDAFSDIDVFVVYGEEEEKPLILHGLKRLEHILNRGIHINLFSLKEFERRLRFHDYLMASIIEDSKFVLGRKEVFDEAKRKILEVRPNEESVRFNRRMGFKSLEHVYSYFNELDSKSHDENLLNSVIKGLNNYRLALGYLYASMQMQRHDEDFSFTRLVQDSFGSKLRELACIERLIKRGAKIDYTRLCKLLDGIKGESLRILTLNRSPPEGSISCRISPFKIFRDLSLSPALSFY